MSDTKTTCCVCGAPVIHHSADEGTQSQTYDRSEIERLQKELVETKALASYSNNKELRKLLDKAEASNKVLRDLVEAKSNLLVCYRTGSHANAGKVLDKIKKLEGLLAHKENK